MSRTLTVNNIPFEYPTSGDEPGWGSGATDWATEVTNVLGNIVGPDDILETAFNIANAQGIIDPPSGFADITGLVFNIGSVRSAVVEYNVNRRSDSQPNGNLESGEIHLAYNNIDGWLMGTGGVVGNSGIVLSITPLGQMQYVSTDIGSVNYVGTMVFSAKSKQQV